MRSMAVIPCHNEAATIGNIVRQCRKQVDRVIVVDNNSRDKTGIEARKAGATVVVCKRRGMGSATSIGIQRALKYGADIIVTLDGDGQHDPSEIRRLVGPVAIGGCDVAVGVREKKHGMPAYRRFGNAIIALAYNYRANNKLSDAQCGFRAFNSDTARSIITQERGFGCITEFLIKARKTGRRIQPIPISCHYHPELRHNSTMNPVLHGVSVLLSTIRWRIWEARKR